METTNDYLFIEIDLMCKIETGDEIIGPVLDFLWHVREHVESDKLRALAEAALLTYTISAGKNKHSRETSMLQVAQTLLEAIKGYNKSKSKSREVLEREDLAERAANKIDAYLSGFVW